MRSYVWVGLAMTVAVAGCATPEEGPPVATPEQPVEEPLVSEEGVVDVVEVGSQFPADLGTLGAIVLREDPREPVVEVFDELATVRGPWPVGEERQVGEHVLRLLGTGEDGRVRLGVVDASAVVRSEVLVPADGAVGFGSEADVTFRAEASTLVLGAVLDPSAPPGRGNDAVDEVAAEAGATLEVAGYRLEVLEVDTAGALVRVTAPDGATLPRARD